MHVTSRPIGPNSLMYDHHLLVLDVVVNLQVPRMAGSMTAWMIGSR